MDNKDSPNSLRKVFAVFQYSRVAIEIVWSTSAALTMVMATTTLVTGILPAAIASVGGLFVDAVSSIFQQTGVSAEQARSDVLFYVFVEVGLVILMTGAQRVNSVCQSIMRVLLGNKINVMILEKALTLELAHFEDAEYYDKLTRARREASSRPLSLVIKTFDLMRKIGKKKEGDVTIKLIRDKQSRTVNVTPRKSDRKSGNLIFSDTDFDFDIIEENEK